MSPCFYPKARSGDGRVLSGICFVSDGVFVSDVRLTDRVVLYPPVTEMPKNALDFVCVLLL